MSYVVLARKLRPTRFDDLVGQETIAQALKNAILTERVSHAFLFTGSRGVGKTTAARVLTKAINCLNPQEANPCEACQNCLDIGSNASPDVFEIDAASNRGIDNIRDLRENIKYTPANCRYKVYIIDEAHMLTLESFNALLKTLEEPPAHVKFILATTDPHKIPQTIISRCQRYDFLRIPRRKMVDYLEKMCREEEIQFPRSALEKVAQHAVGGMRDALTAIDQVIGYSGKTASEEEVARILGVVDSQSRFQLLQALLAKDAQETLGQFYRMQERGHDYQDILSDLLQTLKNLSLIHTLTQQSSALPPTLFQDISKEELEQYQGLVEKVTLDELQQMFHILLELETQIKRSNHAQVCFEMALIQLTAVQPLVGIAELLQQVQTLQNQGGSLPIQTTPRPPANPPPALQKSAVPQKETPQTQRPALPEPPLVSAAPAENLPAASPPEVPHAPSGEWETFVRHVEQKSPRLGGILKNAVLLEKTPHQIQLAFKTTASMLPPDKLASLEQIAAGFYKNPVEILVQKEVESEKFTTLSEKQQQALEQEKERRRQAAEQDATTQLILNTFPGSKIVDIQIQEPTLSSLKRSPDV